MSTNKPQKENKTNSNIFAKCRACLTEETDMNFLFVNFEKNTTLAKIIEESVGYVITREERFSENLCKECTKIIVDFARFKATFWQATQYFKNFNLAQSFIENANDCKGDFKFSVSQIGKAKSEPDKNVSNLTQCGTEFSDNTEHFSDESTAPILQKYKSKKITCKFCDKHFRSKVQLERHKKIEHTDCLCSGIKKATKDLVEKSPEELGVEEILSDSISKTQCKVCKHQFPIEEFEYHFETHKTHVCNTCGHKFIRKTDLNDHQEIHLDVCKYMCQHCGKSFKVRTALNKHKRIHTNPREEVCDVCGQRFNTRDTLKTHYKLKHVKSKDFQCNLCGLAFTLKSTLEKHIERHNPNRQRIYSCNLCSVSYINKYNLSRHHIIKHTAFENRPTCEFCGKKYVKKIDLMKHVKRHHGQNSGEKVTGQHLEIQLKRE